MTEQEILLQMVALQKVDTEIQETEKTKDEFRLEIERLQAKINVLREDFAAKKTQGDALKKQKAAIDLEIKSKESEIKKKQEQTSMVKSNDAYKALQNEIDAMQKAITDFEDRQLEIMSEEEMLVKALKDGDRELKQEEASINLQVKENESKIAAIDASIGEKSARREAAAATVNKNWYERYERIRKNKGGMAVAELYVDNKGNGQCGGCRMSVRAQAVIEVMKNNTIHICENCARMWYVAVKKVE